MINTLSHPLVSIHPDAKIGNDVKIDPFTVIHENVEIGEGTWIGSNVTIMPGARIGKHVQIFPGAVISAIPQDLKFFGEETTAEIGDYTTIREFVTINRGTIDRMTTRVGAHCLIMAYVHIAHDCIVGDHCILANGVTMAGHVVVGNYAVIGGLTAIHQFVKIGEHSMISGGSLVRKDVPPYVKVGREPLSYVGINSTGLRRRGFSNEEINHIQDIYRHIFVTSKNLSNGMAQLDTLTSLNGYKDHVIDFIRQSKRGLIRGFGKEVEE